MARDHTGSFAWFLAGAALGATVALLYAPQSGKDTRRYIRKKTREGTEVLAETGRDFMDKGRDLYDRGRKVADDAAELFERGRHILEG
jgi:gas vesicle protein